MNETKQTELRVRPRRTELAASKPDIEWVKTPKKHWQERLLPNLAIASALMLCAVALKTGAIPPLTDAVQSVMSAATDDSLLNGDLGKLSFVSSIFPEASLVFGESGGKLTMPVEAESVVHAWSQSEPFISWDAQTKIVTSAMAGEVIGVYHGNEDERLVQVLGADGAELPVRESGECDGQHGRHGADGRSAGDAYGRSAVRDGGTAGRLER